jgi:cytochrome c oxidase subunit II
MRGNMALQSSWLLLSIVLAGFLYVYGLQFLNVVSAAPKGDVLTVHVNGEQWLWNYSYPQYQDISGTTLVLPVNRPVEFVITSSDVQHSFWVPALGIKQDAVPGETTHISVTPDVIGDYAVRCAELCGLYHAYMNTPVKVVSQADFDAWVHDQQTTQASHGSPSSAMSAFVVRDLIVRRSTITQEG